MKIGLVPMAARPYHAGHDGLIRIASRENNIVHVYASSSDRGNVRGSDMARLWKDTIEPSLPANVDVTYGGSPVGKVWETLGKANEGGSSDTFSIYGDPTDTARNFPELSLAKYCGNLLKQGQIILRAVERSETVDVSGTAMRSWLGSGDRASFIEHLPATIDRELVWNVLKHDEVQGESLLRSYVNHVVRSR